MVPHDHFISKWSSGPYTGNLIPYTPFHILSCSCFLGTHWCLVLCDEVNKLLHREYVSELYEQVLRLLALPMSFSPPPPVREFLGFRDIHFPETVVAPVGTLLWARFGSKKCIFALPSFEICPSPKGCSRATGYFLPTKGSRL